MSDCHCREGGHERDVGLAGGNDRAGGACQERAGAVASSGAEKDLPLV
jgi:hypothetical protein